MSSTNYRDLCFKVPYFSNLKEMIEYNAKKHPETVAFIYQNKVDDPLTKVTYKEFSYEVSCLATGLVELLKISIEKKEIKKIALLAPNSYYWALTYLATVNLNQVIVPMDWQLPVKDLVNLMTAAGVQAVVFSGVIDKKIKEIKTYFNKMRHYIGLDESREATTKLSKVITLGKKFLQKRPRFYEEIKVYPETMCTLIFTSGTTDVPKGVMLSHKNLIQTTMGACQAIDVDKQVMLSVLPLYHSYECSGGLFCPLYMGTSTVAYMAGGLPQLAANLQKIRPTLVVTVPLLVEGSYLRIAAAGAGEPKKIRQIAKQYFGGRLEKLIVGGAPLNPVISQKLEELGVKALQGYGITENAPFAAVNREKKYKHGSVGLPLPNVKIKINEPDEEGVGEILVWGGTVMLGYYKNERKTDKVIKNNWLYTGDYGYFDEEGFLYIVGREKNIILGKNAKNIYPEELEFVLNNTNGISESMVYGKIIDDDVKAAALIVVDLVGLKKVNPNLSDDPKQKEVEKIISRQIAKINRENVKYKAIMDFQIVSSIPKTTTGKIRRSEKQN
jgi:long-chain acyl-CoA synthetase